MSFFLVKNNKLLSIIFLLGFLCIISKETYAKNNLEIEQEIPGFEDSEGYSSYKDYYNRNDGSSFYKEILKKELKKREESSDYLGFRPKTETYNVYKKEKEKKKIVELPAQYYLGLQYISSFDNKSKSGLYSNYNAMITEIDGLSLDFSTEDSLKQSLNGSKSTINDFKSKFKNVNQYSMEQFLINGKINFPFKPKGNIDVSVDFNSLSGSSFIVRSGGGAYLNMESYQSGPSLNRYDYINSNVFFEGTYSKEERMDFKTNVTLANDTPTNYSLIGKVSFINGRFKKNIVDILDVNVRNNLNAFIADLKNIGNAKSQFAVSFGAGINVEKEYYSYGLLGDYLNSPEFNYDVNEKSKDILKRNKGFNSVFKHKPILNTYGELHTSNKRWYVFSSLDLLETNDISSKNIRDFKLGIGVRDKNNTNIYLGLTQQLSGNGYTLFNTELSYEWLLFKAELNGTDNSGEDSNAYKFTLNLVYRIK